MSIQVREWLIRASLLVGALIHLPPVAGLGGASALARLYGVSWSDPTTLLLLQHRAVLFGLLVLPMLIALKHQSWRMPALLMAITSVAAFLLLGVPADAPWDPSINRVLWVDAIALPCLVLGLVLEQKRAPEGARPDDNQGPEYQGPRPQSTTRGGGGGAE
ncbi:MAG: phosphopantetheine adenylyltransferase [Ahniella sp.]|nr:phosphopantetheine adenylyltransferase [Ahniella sp.]